MILTTMTYTTVDHHTTDPRKHETEEAARAYAAEVTGRIQGEMVLVDQTGKKVAIYSGGVEKAA